MNREASQSRHDLLPPRVYKTHARKSAGGAARSKLSTFLPSPPQSLLAPFATTQCLSVGRELKMDAREAAVIHGLRESGGTQDDRGWVVPVMGSPPEISPSGSSSLFSSTSSLTDDDDVTSSPPGERPVLSSSSSCSLTSSESSDKMQTDVAAAEGPLYELSTMLDHLPALRTGLSKFYRGRSQSFTSLAEVSCAEDLAKKTGPYVRGAKASRCYAAALSTKNQLSKKIAKKVQSSPDHLLSRARSTSLLRSSARPPAYHGKREVYRC